ncbi:MAG: ABC-ATPase domain-containing protein, partial [Myxococcota bacterium]
MATAQELEATLHRIDGRGYKAYRDIRGSWEFSGYTLAIDHVQGDPFAAPSQLRARVPAGISGFPAKLFSDRTRKMALADWLARRIRSAIHGTGTARVGSGRSGLIAIDAGRQEVLERSAILVTSEWVEARVSVGLPAAGRRVLGQQAAEIFCRTLPEVIDTSLQWEQLPKQEIQDFVDAIENQESIRQQLRGLGLIAFLGDGSILPRESGASDLPLRDGSAVAFHSPPEFAVEIEVPNPVDPEDRSTRRISGMGIPEGVTLVVGGGYHGKSTLLRALERGVYPHIPGDGREWVVSARDLVKVRAEDGRAVTGVDISAFIGSLPGAGGAADSRSFSTADASG